MTKVLSIFSHKGGVGKTSVTINLAAAFSLILSHKNPEDPKKVLVIDLDEQAHSATFLAGGFFNTPLSSESSENIATLLLGTSTLPIKDVIQKSRLPIHSKGKLDYIPSNRSLMARIESIFRKSGIKALYKLDDLLFPILNDYEYIIIDNPPGMNFTNLNGLVASTHVVVLSQLETPAIESLSNAIQTIHGIQDTHNSSLEIAGILPNMCDFRMSEHTQFLKMLKSHYRDNVLPPISRKSDITYATTKGLDIFSYKPPRSKNEIESKNNSVVEFAKLANALIKKMNR